MKYSDLHRKVMLVNKYPLGFGWVGNNQDVNKFAMNCLKCTDLDTKVILQTTALMEWGEGGSRGGGKFRNNFAKIASSVLTCTEKSCVPTTYPWGEVVVEGSRSICLLGIA